MSSTSRCSTFHLPVSRDSVVLHVNVAERAAEGRHSSRYRDTGSIHTKINKILKSGVAAWRRVVERDGAGDSILAGRQVLVLPNPAMRLATRLQCEIQGVQRTTRYDRSEHGGGRSMGHYGRSQHTIQDPHSRCRAYPGLTKMSPPGSPPTRK